MTKAIVKTNSAKPVSISGLSPELKAQAEEIQMVAEIFGLEGSQLKHLKRAFFFAGIGNGLVPDAFQGDYRSIFIMSQLAEKMDCPLSEVMQGGYFVHGRWGWYAEFMISRVLALGIFTAIDYEFGGNLQDDTLWFKAIGTRPDGTKAEGTTVSMKMARAENWTKNQKYQTMPALMLKKRAATFLIRECAPHIFGGQTATVEENEDRKVDTTVITTGTDARPVMAAIVAEERKSAEESQRLDVLDRVEKKIAIRKQGGQEDYDLEQLIGMPLDQIENLKIEQLMAVYELVK